MTALCRNATLSNMFYITKRSDILHINVRCPNRCINLRYDRIFYENKSNYETHNLIFQRIRSWVHSNTKSADSSANMKHIGTPSRNYFRNIGIRGYCRWGGPHKSHANLFFEGQKRIEDYQSRDQNKRRDQIKYLISF